MTIRLLADEHFDFQICRRLRRLGYDVTHARQLSRNRRGDRDSDEYLLNYAIEHRMVLLTDNVRDFRRLSKKIRWHEGIVACKVYDDPLAKAEAIDALLRKHRQRGGRYTGKWMRLPAQV